LVGERLEALFVKGSGVEPLPIEPPGVRRWIWRTCASCARSASCRREMVNQLRTHLFDAGAPNPSGRDAASHAFLPHRFIDHTTPTSRWW